MSELKKCQYCGQYKPKDTFVLKQKCWDCGQVRKCWTCGEYRPISEFAQATGKGCRACRESGLAKKKKAERDAARYRANRDEVLARNREWKAKSPTYPCWQREYRKAQRRKVRDAVLAYYGGKCACCGETEPMFLTIDHIDGNGGQHRRMIGKADIWKWLKTMDFPPGFQLLCFNCNAGKYRNGGVCPHESVAK